jgi:hypothetical protein
MIYWIIVNEPGEEDDGEVVGVRYSKSGAEALKRDFESTIGGCYRIETIGETTYEL